MQLSIARKAGYGGGIHFGELAQPDLFRWTLLGGQIALQPKGEIPQTKELFQNDHSTANYYVPNPADNSKDVDVHAKEADSKVKASDPSPAMVNGTVSTASGNRTDASSASANGGDAITIALVMSIFRADARSIQVQSETRLSRLQSAAPMITS
ncbi:hypothetical protein B0H19DRAFT_1081391 [Mycena capillaripes]|nr:hypothetical protein B0H19DRAFT_1081165 [Mycena capillaripes]KAJ6533235.1 hypothetical protein B0H19DRAFT_1081391 [Mycena capillaripes]